MVGVERFTSADYKPGLVRHIVLFKCNPAVTPEQKARSNSPLHSFAGGSDGQSPNSSLLVTSDGDLYGTTITGALPGNGTIYKISP